MTSSLGGVRLAVSLGCIVRGDIGLNIFNSHSVRMIHENCVLQGRCTGARNNCIGADTLTDRKNLDFPISTDYLCRSYLQNSRTLSLIDSLHILVQSVSRVRLEVAGEGVESVGRATSLYRQGLLSAQYPAESLRKQVEEIWGDLTRGHWQRGVT